MLRITRVTYFYINRSRETDPLAKCSAVLEDSLMLNDIRIFNSRDGSIVISLPFGITEDKRRKRGGEIFHPLTKDYYKYFAGVITEGYKECKKNNESVYIP